MNKFLSKLVMTREINNCISDDGNFMKEVLKALSRYKNHDWGDLPEEDKQMNDEAIKKGNDRVFASYKTSQGKIYIIAEYDRSYTTILFSHEY